MIPVGWDKEASSIRLSLVLGVAVYYVTNSLTVGVTHAVSGKVISKNVSVKQGEQQVKKKVHDQQIDYLSILDTSTSAMLLLDCSMLHC